MFGCIESSKKTKRLFLLGRVLMCLFVYLLFFFFVCFFICFFFIFVFCFFWGGCFSLQAFIRELVYVQT